VHTFRKEKRKKIKSVIIMRGVILFFSLQYYLKKTNKGSWDYVALSAAGATSAATTSIWAG
jgi:hypothetical protein